MQTDTMSRQAGQMPPNADAVQKNNRRSSIERATIDKNADRSEPGNLHDSDMNQLIQENTQQRSLIKELECRLEQERRQNKETMEEFQKERNALQYRYKMKELRLQEVLLQFKQFKDNQAPTYQRLRQCYLDPSVNLIFEKMKAEVEDNKKAKEDAISDLQAWSFTAESQTGKRLVTRCKKLLQENEEFGKMVTSGNVAKLNTEIAMQKRLVDDMHANEKEYDALVLEMDEELDLLTCACKQLQHKLYETVQLSLGKESSGVHKSEHYQSTKSEGKQQSNRTRLVATETVSAAQQVVVVAKQAIEQSQQSNSRHKVQPNSSNADYSSSTLKRTDLSSKSGGKQQQQQHHSSGTIIGRSNCSTTNSVIEQVDGSKHGNCDQRPPTSSNSPAYQNRADVSNHDQNDWRTETNKKSSKEENAALDDYHSNSAKLKPSSKGFKESPPSKRSTDSEKRRKPQSGDVGAFASNQSKNKRRTRRFSSEEQDKHSSKVQKENNQQSEVAASFKHESAGDSSRRSPHSPGSGNGSKRSERKAASKTNKSSNWDVERSPSHGRQRDGLRSPPVNKSCSSSATNKNYSASSSSSRKFESRRSPNYRHSNNNEQRRRRHSPTRNYR